MPMLELVKGGVKWSDVKTRIIDILLYTDLTDRDKEFEGAKPDFILLKDSEDITKKNGWWYQKDIEDRYAKKSGLNKIYLKEMEKDDKLLERAWLKYRERSRHKQVLCKKVLRIRRDLNAWREIALLRCKAVVEKDEQTGETKKINQLERFMRSDYHLYFGEQRYKLTAEFFAVIHALVPECFEVLEREAEKRALGKVPLERLSYSEQYAIDVMPLFASFLKDKNEFKKGLKGWFEQGKEKGYTPLVMGSLLFLIGYAEHNDVDKLGEGWWAELDRLGLNLYFKFSAREEALKNKKHKTEDRAKNI